MWSLTLTICACVVVTLGDMSASLNEDILVFPKCCQKSQSLIEVSEAKETGPRFVCTDSENITKTPLFVGDDYKVQYGMLEDCDEMLVTEVVQPTVKLSDFNISLCYDKLVQEAVNGTKNKYISKIVMLRCMSKEIDEKYYNTTIHFGHIRKCCGRGQKYDLELHSCMNTGNFTDFLQTTMSTNKDYVYEIESELVCKVHENTIDLGEEKFKFEIMGSVLTVSSKSDGRSEQFFQTEWCLEQNYKSPDLVARVCSQNCSTFNTFCFRKCCPIGQHYHPRRCGRTASNCVKNTDNTPFFNISYYLDPLKNDDPHYADALGFRSDLHCPTQRFVLNKTTPQDRHHLTRDAVIEVDETPFMDTSEFCLEAFDMRSCGGNIDVTAILCFIEKPPTKNFSIAFVMNCLSAVCLALTLVVYCSLPELRNLHGKTLICQVSMMFLACSCLARAQYGSVKNTKICTFIGYSMYFGFVAAFVWLNVMCIDIWWTFGSIRSVQPLRKASSERRRFAWYSLYAWSVATLLTLTVLLLDLYPISRVLDANMGTGMCWFGSDQNSKSDWPHYIFFVIPMGLVTGTNLVLWVLTARHCARVKAEVHRLQAGSVGDRAKKNFRIDRAKYVLTGKLWVVMGVSWASEMLSTVVMHPTWLWNIIDLFNELQGVFVFIILVLKPKIFRLIMKKLGLGKADAQTNRNSSNARTSSTFLSRTISNDERTNLAVSLQHKQT